MTEGPSGSTNPHRVEILLATYDGGEFLAEQIDSLFRQSYGNWRILARDDGSGDGTVEILRDYAARHPDRLVLVTDGDGNLGYVGNFARLLALSTSAPASVNPISAKNADGTKNSQAGLSMKR